MGALDDEKRFSAAREVEAIIALLRGKAFICKAYRNVLDLEDG
jgi:hypothetical protein